MVKAFRREEEVYIKGIIKWMKHIKPDMTFPPGKWSHVMYVEGPELEKVRELQAEGIKNAVKRDDDGWYITLSRKCSLTTRDGRVRGLEPPFVFRQEGENKIPLNTPVGNGSTGISKCMLWSFNPEPMVKGLALRWESTRIDNLIEYEMNNNFPEARLVKGMDEQEPLF